jgi:branched-chain amino acid transport system permease protein
MRKTTRGGLAYHMITTISQLITDGISMGIVYVILSAGLVLIMSVSGIFFMAYGQFYMIGAFTTWAGIALFKLPFYVAILISIFITTILGLLSYRYVFKYVQNVKRQFLAVVVCAVGLMWILGQVGLLIFGTVPRTIPPIFPGILMFQGVSVPIDKLILTLLAIIVTLVLFLVYEKTNIGKVVQAVAFNPEAAALHGIEPNNVYLAVMGIGGALAGFAGGIIAPTYSVSPDMGNNIILTLMLIVMLGGMDSLMGAIPAGLILGLTLSFGQYFIQGNAQILLYIVIGIIIFIRPNGLLGHGAQMKV